MQRLRYRPAFDRLERRDTPSSLLIGPEGGTVNPVGVPPGTTPGPDTPYEPPPTQPPSG